MASAAPTAYRPASAIVEPLENPMTTLSSDLALANRILSNENVMDAFGHVSCRHPADPGRFLLSTGLAPILVQEKDIIEYGLDAKPVVPTDLPLYGEAVIHSEIYKARPDVQSICHHHAPAIMPFCVSGERLLPVCQTGGSIGAEAPFWDSQDEFGDTNLLLTRPEEGASLARALGPHWIVLMRRHGATVVGVSLREMVFRAMHSVANATMQMQAKLLGHVDVLRPGEVALVTAPRPSPVERNWAYAKERLARVERRSA